MTRFMLILFCVGLIPTGARAIDLSRIRLPAGFTIEVYAEVPGARSLAVAPELDAVFIGTRDDRVWVLRDTGFDGRDMDLRELLSGYTMPNGVAWDGQSLFVAERRKVLRFDFPDPAALAKRPHARALYEGLPSQRWHGWRDIALGPDNRVYVAVGAPCNVCAVRGWEGTIVALAKTGGRPVVFARGVRNSVGMDFHPRRGDLFFTDNGADNMGDDLPPDELNRAATPGLHFGYPWFGGGDARTPQFDGQTAPENTTAPVVAFGAHVAALGLHFYRGTAFPSAYRTDAFVAQHGSWNRSVPDGYRVMRIEMDETGIVRGRRVFAEGWLRPDGEVIGRPVDIAELPDGSLLVSDDHADLIYRIRYQTP